METEVQRHSFLTSALYVDHSVSDHGRFTHGENPSVTMGGGLSPTVNPDEFWRRDKFIPSPGFEPRSVQSLS